MDPETTLDPRYSNPGAQATPWTVARDQLRDAQTYLLTTVRPDGRPHQTTIAGVWLGETFGFVTGSEERKARNLAAGNRHVLVSTGCSGWEGMDIVLEGEAALLTDGDRLQQLVDEIASKYGDLFGFRLVDGRIHSPDSPGEPMAFEIDPRQAFGFGKGAVGGQTRWRFSTLGGSLVG
jgi:hypothetical protein